MNLFLKTRRYAIECVKMGISKHVSSKTIVKSGAMRYHMNGLFEKNKNVKASCFPLQMRRFQDFLFLPEKFSTQFQVPVPEFSWNTSTAPWNSQENLIVSLEPSSIVFIIYHFPINQSITIVYEFWKCLTRETTLFTKSGDALLESASQICPFCLFRQAA